MIYNKYQTIPKNTVISECNYTTNMNDKWKYFLIEILNPDLAISTFYINIVQKPFICSTYIEDNICKMNVYLRIENSNIKFSVKHKQVYNGNIHNFPKDLLNMNIKQIISPFFKNNVDDYIKDYLYDNYLIKD